MVGTIYQRHHGNTMSVKTTLKINLTPHSLNSFSSLSSSSASGTTFALTVSIALSNQRSHPEPISTPHEKISCCTVLDTTGQSLTSTPRKLTTFFLYQPPP